MSVMAAWIGNSDLNAADRNDASDLGPIAQALLQRAFDEVLLLADQSPARVEKFASWLRARSRAVLTIDRVKLSSPTNFGEIYKAATSALDRLAAKQPGKKITFHVSPGTPAMAAVWILLAKTRYPAELIESSKGHGIQTVSVPFDISAEFLPDLLRGPDEELEK
jgi:hypothetical protein